MTTVLGWDIGGANIKLACIKGDNNRVTDVKISISYFPIWKRGKEKLLSQLTNMVSNVNEGDFDAVLVTMTAELSDVYFSKKEGVHHIIDTVDETFRGTHVLYLDVYGNLLPSNEARERYLDVAASNWFATGWLASKLASRCVVVDIGSTSTSIIPVSNGSVNALGLNDLEKLSAGELIYTGALRTNVAAIVDHVFLHGDKVPVSSEFFAQSGDVHLFLGNIKPDEYTVDTPDGRGLSRREVAARIARVICADLDLLSYKDIEDISRYVYDAQVDYIADGIKRFLAHHNNFTSDTPVYVTGLGASFLAVPALRRNGFRDIRYLSEYIGSKGAKATPAFALALMGYESMRGGVEGWMRF